MLFRDNIKPSIDGKHVILLSATTTTGRTIHSSLEGIQYYGGIVESIASLFSIAEQVEGYRIESVFTADDLPGYATYSAQECPFCRKGHRIEAVVNGFGYSKL
jgi:orotate phosphoribosyltransferase